MGEGEFMGERQLQLRFMERSKGYDEQLSAML